jgi:two-component system KDP operon response regulator KdpE
MNGIKVLLIDDDSELLHLSSHIFKGAGAQVITARDGAEGISKMLAHRPNLILLDIRMPDISGFDLCKIIRKMSNVPLIMLTAFNIEKNLVQALEAGADDFLAKPFKAAILLARVHALLRRSEYEKNVSTKIDYYDGHLTVDHDRTQILINGKRVNSSPTEFRLLTYLIKNAGKTLSYEQLLCNVWGAEYRGNVDIVHVYISALRSKIEENPKHPRYIHLVYGVGYIFERQNCLSTPIMFLLPLSWGMIFGINGFLDSLTDVLT